MDVVRGLGYVLAFRVVMLAFTGRRRDVRLVLLVPRIGGAVIAASWAIGLVLVHTAFGVILGARRDVPRDPITTSQLLSFLVAEACLLAVGVGIRRTVSE